MAHESHKLILLGASDISSGSYCLATHESRARFLGSLQDVLEAKAEPLRKMGWQVLCVVKDGSAAAAILQTAEAEEVDAIMMSTHCWAGIGRFLEGSVAERVARYSPCPVILVRPPQR